MQTNGVSQSRNVQEQEEGSKVRATRGGEGDIDVSLWPPWCRESRRLRLFLGSARCLSAVRGQGWGRMGVADGRTPQAHPTPPRTGAPICQSLPTAWLPGPGNVAGAAANPSTSSHRHHTLDKRSRASCTRSRPPYRRGDRLVDLVLGFGHGALGFGLSPLRPERPAAEFLSTPFKRQESR
ncbi:hypothetical protein EJ04DRAFT_594014 [Polyplosphaeria fusca]|uniref:Uncharacterized protein n=1 Tax=Polyplosphaeria fusca TaxID=682080 RepID=A0A9P4UWB8_9PLEO|nr:hypothetical protein EJ04DRAFT_594014 [Polyplosphaeria fusca]